jgi:hypothetical protein
MLLPRHATTTADVCWRMLTYADVCWRMLTRRMLAIKQPYNVNVAAEALYVSAYYYICVLLHMCHTSACVSIRQHTSACVNVAAEALYVSAYYYICVLNTTTYVSSILLYVSSILRYVCSQYHYMCVLNTTSSGCTSSMLLTRHATTTADVCGRMLTYADVCWRMLTYADVCWRMLTYADVCWRMLTYADVCWRMLTYADEAHACHQAAVQRQCYVRHTILLYIYICTCILNSSSSIAGGGEWQKKWL